MTPSDRRAAIAALGFDSQRSFARFMHDRGGWDERTVRRWFAAGNERPHPAVDSWLTARSKAMLADPPPLARP